MLIEETLFGTVDKVADAIKRLQTFQPKDRPYWLAFRGCGGMLGVYTGDYVEFPSDVNYATGEDAKREPMEIREIAD